jgi:competence protein ComGC
VFGVRPRVKGRAARRPGFTITEFLLTLIIVFMLITLLIVAVNRAKSAAAMAAERHNVNAMKIGVEYFQQEFGFQPPLVRDYNAEKYLDYANKVPDPPAIPGANEDGPLNSETFDPQVYSTGNPPDLAFLRAEQIDFDPSKQKDYRFSEYSIPYYLIGTLGATPNGKLIDGVKGPGFRTPTRAGSFMDSGRQFDAFFTPSSRAQGVVATDAAAGRFELRDANGVAYRYYRWEQGRANGADIGELVDIPEDFNVPDLVGDAGDNVALRGATWAIVAAGPNGVFGDATEGVDMDAEEYWAFKLGSGSPEQLKRRAREDNIVEVGQ